MVARIPMVLEMYLLCPWIGLRPFLCRFHCRPFVRCPAFLFCCCCCCCLFACAGVLESLCPGFDLHGALLLEISVHLESMLQGMRLVEGLLHGTDACRKIDILLSEGEERVVFCDGRPCTTTATISGTSAADTAASIGHT